MSGPMLAILTSGAIVIAFCVGLFLLSSMRSARFLEQRCVTELVELKSLLSSRHLIVSHLTDSIPSRFEGLFDRKRLQKGLRAAEKSLQTLDPACPDFADMRSVEHSELSLIELVNDLKETVEATDSVVQIESVSGCLDGLARNSKEILEAVSTYNSAAITFSSYLRSSMFARRQFECNFAILELDPPGSSLSGDSGMSSDGEISSDRVAS